MYIAALIYISSVESILTAAISCEWHWWQDFILAVMGSTQGLVHMC